MHTRANRIPPALSHGAYSATAVLPGESRTAFEKLHQGLIAEFTPSGVTEDDIVADMARLMWRKQNLGTLRTAERAQGQWFAWSVHVSEEDREKAKEGKRATQERLRKELGDTFEFIEIGSAATFDGLTKELETEERLGALIEKCLKRLLLVRGLKSVSTAPSSAPPQPVLGPPKAA